MLWHVSDSDSKDRKIFREMSRDLFEARLKDTASLSKLYNCNAKIYPKDVLAQVVLSNNLRPRRGHHWEVTFSEMKLLMDDVDVAAVDGGGESK